ncbi:hypothetical protein GCM10020369_73700 [Cryptosporangium minutisporangium]|uniref:DUF4829 domain-containing protein n=1 Tax=Cryptosporangium minutisporangium TaxID=113569 RepID=A0ABP6T9E2_9ACTN
MRRWAAFAVACVAVVALLSLYLWAGVPIRRGHVAVPPAAAGPDDVMRAYFDAVDANDKATQRALWAAGRAPGIDSDDVRTVTGVRVVEQDAYVPLPEDPAELSAYRDVVRLLMSFRVHYWPVHDDPQQPTATFYLLVRNGAHEPWRIWGAGAFV